MKTTLFAAAACALLTGSLATQSGRIVDLGHPIRAADPSWDGATAFERTASATFEQEGYATGRVSVEEHFGTHVDAPAHFAPDGWTVDQIPVERLYRPGVRIDVAPHAAQDSDYRVIERAPRRSHRWIRAGCARRVACCTR